MLAMQRGLSMFNVVHDHDSVRPVKTGELN